MIGDTDLKISKLYGMLPADLAGTCDGRTAADNQTVRNVFVIGPDKKIKLIIVYPMTTGRNFDEVLRVIDSLQLTAKHKVATPVNWKQGDDVIIAGSVSDDDAKKTYPEGWKSPRPYIRIVPQPRPYSPESGRYDPKQFYLNVAHASYLVGDDRDRDGRRRRSATRRRAIPRVRREHRLRITHVFLTHFHADFIAGHLELRDRTGATIYLGRRGEAEYAFTPLGDGEVIEFGGVRLRCWKRRGTRPNRFRSSSTTSTRERARSPHAVLTGDTLFVGDVGRPDLARVARLVRQPSLAGCSYDSLHDKLLTLPDDDAWSIPAHGAGSLCGKALSKETLSTIGEQRALNYALQPMSQGGVRRAGDRRSARRAGVFHLRRGVEQPGAADARRGAGARAESADTRTACWRCRRTARRSSIRAIRRSSQRRISPAASTSASAASTRRGRARCWNQRTADRIVADPGARDAVRAATGRIGFDQVVGFLEGGLASRGA